MAFGNTGKRGQRRLIKRSQKLLQPGEVIQAAGAARSPFKWARLTMVAVAMFVVGVGADIAFNDPWFPFAILPIFLWGFWPIVDWKVVLVTDRSLVLVSVGTWTGLPKSVSSRLPVHLPDATKAGTKVPVELAGLHLLFAPKEYARLRAATLAQPVSELVSDTP